MSRHALSIQHPRHRPSLRARGLIVCTVTMVGIAGGATASWSADAAVSNQSGMFATELTVNQTSVINDLSPGRPHPLAGTFDNPSEDTVTVSSVTAEVIDVTAAADGSSTCNPTDFAITGAGTGTSTVVPAGHNQGHWSGLSLSLKNTHACANAVVVISYTAT